jgi:long-chain acyl-CoA synthetase
VPEGAINFRALVAEDTSGLPAPPDAEQVACLQYTSGTTGRPKGAMLTHANILSNARASIEAVSMTEEDVFLAVLPLFHVFGATVTMVIPIVLGAASAHLPRFEPLPVLQTIERTGVTLFCGVPSMFAVLAALKGADGPDLSTLRLCISGGAALPRELTPIIEGRYETTLLEGYGPTEASPVISVNRDRESRKIGSVGPPLPGVEVEIRDEDGKRVKTGEIGEICARGPNVMRGYWQDEEKTANTIRDGWLYTGDLGHVDEDGYIYIVDRKTDMIIVGGLNVYPREVEDVVRLLDPVRDVAVVGATSRLRGETVCAFVELHEGGSLDQTEIVEHCTEHLARYKVPRNIRFIGELPRSATGKVLKRELRGRFSLRG